VQLSLSAVYYYLLTKLTMQGTVKFFNEAKGFGFIKPADSSEDIFVHSSGLIDEIRENDKVEYDSERGKKGMNAVNVKVVG
jgi:CspA family cold shock protein